MTDLKTLRAQLEKLTGQATAKRAELKDDTPTDVAARIETEHAAILAEVENTRGELAKLEAAPPNADAIQRAIREDRERQGAIRALGKRFNQDDFAEDHAGRDTTVETFRGILLDRIAEAGGERIIPHVTVGMEDSEKRAAAIEAAILHRCDGSKYPLDDAAKQFRGMRLMEMGRDFLGQRARGMDQLTLSAALLGLDAGEKYMRAGGLMATSDFPSILANVANKTLRAAYQAAPQTFRPIVRVTTLPDFKPVSRTQLSEAPAFKKVNEHGEFTRGAMSDAKEVYSLATFGRVVGITRQTLINDDMDAFSRIPAAFGVSAANLESDLVWSKILANGTMGDGHALFDLTYHANINSSGAISVTTVGAGRAQMSKQTGLDGVTILNIDPVYLVVPKALQTVAEQFVGTTLVPALTSSVVPDSLRRLIVISEPRLDNGVTDPSNATAYSGSASHWYLMASPAQVDMIELAYLEGQQGVFTETRMGFDVDGMEIKVRLDAAAKVIDWRGFNQNAN